MTRFFTATSLGCMALLSGCGPSAPTPSVDPTLDESYTLVAPPAELGQGDSATVIVTIARGKNFEQAVPLRLENLPTGVIIEPANPVVDSAKIDVSFILKATTDVVPGDYSLLVVGHPEKGEKRTSEMILSVVAMDSSSTMEATSEKWSKYTLEMQKQWDTFSEKLSELSARAAKAEGDAKVELDAKVAAAKEKLDTAGVRLEEMKSASADRWEKIKEASANAFDELKKAFD